MLGDKVEVVHKQEEIHWLLLCLWGPRRWWWWWLIREACSQREAEVDRRSYRSRYPMARLAADLATRTTADGRCKVPSAQINRFES